MSKPRHDAQIRLRAMLDKIRSMPDFKPDIIPMTDYVDADTFGFLCGYPPQNWPFEHWKQVNQLVKEGLEKNGFKVKLVRVTLDEFYTFLSLHGIENTPQNRAAFVSWILIPEPRPIVSGLR